MLGADEASSEKPRVDLGDEEMLLLLVRTIDEDADERLVPEFE